MSETKTIQANGKRGGVLIMTPEQVEAQFGVKPQSAGFISADGRETPKARKSAAALRREALIAADVTTVTRHEIAGTVVGIVSWGRDDRAAFRGEVMRAMKGEIVPSETEIENPRACAIAAALLGVRDESGAAYFTAQDIEDYENDPEDDGFLTDCIWKVYEANPKVWPPEQIAEAQKKIAG